MQAKSLTHVAEARKGLHDTRLAVGAGRGAASGDRAPGETPEELARPHLERAQARGDAHLVEASHGRRRRSRALWASMLSARGLRGGAGVGVGPGGARAPACPYCVQTARAFFLKNNFRNFLRENGIASAHGRALPPSNVHGANHASGA